jgi:hypothetical protein
LSVKKLIDDLAEKSIFLKLQDSNVKIVGNREAVTADVIEIVKLRKIQIVEHLKSTNSRLQSSEELENIESKKEHVASDDFLGAVEIFNLLLSWKGEMDSEN